MCRHADNVASSGNGLQGMLVGRVARQHSDFSTEAMPEHTGASTNTTHVLQPFPTACKLLPSACRSCKIRGDIARNSIGVVGIYDFVGRSLHLRFHLGTPVPERSTGRAMLFFAMGERGPVEALAQMQLSVHARIGPIPGRRTRTSRQKQCQSIPAPRRILSLSTAPRRSPGRSRVGRSMTRTLRPALLRLLLLRRQQYSPSASRGRRRGIRPRRTARAGVRPCQRAFPAGHSRWMLPVDSSGSSVAKSVSVFR